ncbi:hypothetical protein PVK06_015351 [Gossypium arboreum]|uniref:Uncharacterized protein n=1 Tax=Gossypium arboreum TaxID=29729 RepID=A0ABR0PX40_GOSAR|nr:hypothetical protein PVK06_015351 [Gossypium arboreum]
MILYSAFFLSNIPLYFKSLCVGGLNYDNEDDQASISQEVCQHDSNTHGHWHCSRSDGITGARKRSWKRRRRQRQRRRPYYKRQSCSGTLFFRCRIVPWPSFCHGSTSAFRILRFPFRLGTLMLFNFCPF